MVLKVRGDNAPKTELKDDAATVDAATNATTMQQDLANTDNADNLDTNASAGGDDSNEDAGSALIDGGTGAVIEDAGATTSAQADNAEAGAGDAGAGAEPEQATDDTAPEPEAEQPKAQADQPTPASRSGTAVAAKTTSTGVAVSTAGGDKVTEFLAQLAEEGQAGLEMGYGVFPVLSLDKGEFKINDEDIGSEAFSGVALQSMPKFAYRMTNVPDKEAEVAFSDTDTAHLEPESPISVKLAEWKIAKPESGWEIKTYQNVIFYVHEMPAKPVYEGQLVILSVAPQSIRRYTGTCLTIKSKGYKVHEAVMQVSRGEKVRGDFEFYPWHFAALGSCRKLGVEVKFGTQVDENF